jgi:eukaryotic-like serine/threonine-protein kinase
VFKFITHRPLWVNILTGIALAVIILFIFVFSLNWCTHHNESKTVPSVIGKSFDAAQELLTNEGFEVVIQDSVYTDTTKPLTVIKQVPEGDELVKVNRKVYLTINRAVPPMAEVPNLNGYSYRSAEMALKNANLQLGEISYRHDFSHDAVLEMIYNGKTIAPFSKVRMGSRISLVISDGPGETQIPVPSLKGLTYCEAKSLLSGQGIEFGVILAPGISDTCNAYIFWQRPEKYDDDHKLRYMRAGQMIDIRLQQDKPVMDSMNVTTPEPQPEL